MKQPREMNSPHRGRTRLFVGVACAGVVALSVLVSSASSRPASDASAGLKPASIKTFHTYVGGKLGKANPKLSPITIGFVNSVGGETSLPWYNTEVGKAVSLIDNDLDGIDGHELKVAYCNVPTAEAQGQACAEQYLADPDVKAIMTQGLNIGSTDLHATLDGKIPIIASVPTTPADGTASNSFYLTSGEFGASGIVTYIAKYLHAKSVALLNANDVPVAVEAAGLLKGGLEAAGISVTQGTFSAATTDYLPAIEASNAAQSNVVISTQILPSQCLAMAQDLKQAGVTKPTVIGFYSCLTSSIKKSLGDYPKWTYFDFAPNILGPAANGVQAAQFAATKAWEAPFANQVPDLGSASLALSTVLTVAKEFNEIGPGGLTPAAISAKMHAFTGPEFAGPTQEKFGASPVFPDLGTLASYFPIYGGHGKWTDLTHGRAVLPPAQSGPPPTS